MSERIIAVRWLSCLLTMAICHNVASADGRPQLSAPSGFTIELVAGPPLVERPIVAAFDDEGRLYVAESSGSNESVDVQLKSRPHRIVRLEDDNGDGLFDRRVVFADRMMFPAGAMFLDGSLYVAAPPSIWKLTDTDGDGQADQRVEWFQGKTLTGCANDLHGPYAGPDGWIYWCKGAFAEQTYTVNGREWKTTAAHIFRCRADGTGFEPVMTGGMDNPVDVAFTADGERLLTATYLVGEGRRDGLVHAIYGGVYGKNHGVLAGHPRTGDLMPALLLMSPAAPCGLERYDSPAFGPDFRDNLFVCEFNLRKVSRHVLKANGSSFTTQDSDFVVSDHVDFHPTDVLADADGSLLVVDTGGWYKLCCPTSQLWKPDVLGGIYRVRKTRASTVDDPRGRRIAWKGESIQRLWRLLGDPRPEVRRKATREFVRRRDAETMTPFLDVLAWEDVTGAKAYPDAPDDTSQDDAQAAALARTWALSQLEAPRGQALLRDLLHHPDDHVRHAALNSVSLHRDAAATPRLLEILAHDSASNRRVAAEALGRIGDPLSVPALLAAAGRADDRALEHAITYALIEIHDASGTTKGLSSKHPATVATALLALDQMPGGTTEPNQVIQLLNSRNDRLREAARWIVMQHQSWAKELGNWVVEQLKSMEDEPTGEHPLEALVIGFASQLEVQETIANAIVSRAFPASAKTFGLRVIARSNLAEPPPSWLAALARTIAERDPQTLALAIAAARALPPAKSPHPELSQTLSEVADDARIPMPLRVTALAIAAPSLNTLTQAQFTLLIDALSPDQPVAVRSPAADALSVAPLKPDQLTQLCDKIPTASPLELNRLLLPFERSVDEQLGLKLLSALKEATSLSSLRIDVLRHALGKYSVAVHQGIDEIESVINIDAPSQRRRIEELLPLVDGGDVRRGHEVFYSSKAACSACHRVGFAGGTVGPELTHIGDLRTVRDLLESILYPSLSFVRSYEPVVLVTADGKVVNGRLRDETEAEYFLATGPNEELRIRREDVEEIQPSNVSVMPAGLDKQLSVQELSDLIAFLRNAK